MFKRLIKGLNKKRKWKEYTIGTDDVPFEVFPASTQVWIPSADAWSDRDVTGALVAGQSINNPDREASNGRPFKGSWHTVKVRVPVN